MKSVVTRRFFADGALAFSLLLSMAIAATEVPLWTSTFATLMILWRFAHEKFGVPRFSKKVIPIFGVAIFVVVYLQYKTVLGQEESTTVLLGLVSLSVLNYESERDNLFLVLLGFLILVIKSVFSLDFIWTLPSLFSFFGLWYSLLSNAKLNKLKFLFNVTLKSMPMVVVLFIFFPRLVLFQTKQTKQMIVQSGFNEDLNPGQFSEVALQTQMVFRADFQNNRMNTDELYWRGAVLNVSQGLIWHKDQSDRVANMREDEADAVNYRIIMEPQSVKNVFMLDSPLRVVSASSPISRLQYQTYVLPEIQTQQLQYEGQAQFNPTRIDPDDPTDLRKYLNTLELPPKTKAFVEEIKTKKLNARQRIDFLKKFFTERGFIYTLKPEKYRNNLDDFLFDRKKGFCEHYAAAFGSLARALDIPSRIILGYQGGLYNSLGNFWKISQRDAHAWVEVGLDGRWVRVDPTGWVTPLRLSLGGENYFSLSEDEQILYSKNRNWKKPESFDSFLMQIRLAFDNLNYYWTVLLLNYDLQTQLQYLKGFRGNGFLGAILIALLFIAGALIRNQRRRQMQSPTATHRLFSQIEDWGRAQGLQFQIHQTPLQVLEQIAATFPSTQSILQDVSRLYVKAVYQTPDQDENENENAVVKRLQTQWKNIISQTKKRAV